MGFTYLKVFVAHLADQTRGREVEFLVDTGAFQTMIPREILEELGVEPMMERTFTLASVKWEECTSATRISRDTLWSFSESPATNLCLESWVLGRWDTRSIR